MLPGAPFSQRFLPIFEKYAQSKTQTCLQVKTDDKASLCEKYSVEVVPTVLLFEKRESQKTVGRRAGSGTRGGATDKSD